MLHSTMQLDRMGEEKETKGRRKEERGEVQDGEEREGFPIMLRQGLPVCDILPQLQYVPLLLEAVKLVPRVLAGVTLTTAFPL